MTPVTSMAQDLPPDLQKLIGPGPVLTPEDLGRAIQNDLGISHEQRQSLFTMLNSPNMADHLLAGAGGAAIGLVLARYKKMSGTAQALMSLAGFGLGNIIMNSLIPQSKFTSWNPETAKNRVLL